MRVPLKQISEASGDSRVTARDGGFVSATERTATPLGVVAAPLISSVVREESSLELRIPTFWAGFYARLERWYESSGGKERVTAMEGLRGLAIVLVFFCHLQMVVLQHVSALYQGRIATMCAEIGGTGVDLFFLLSGMLIYRAAKRPSLHYGRFLMRRVQRIYPTFLVVLAFYLVLSLGFHVGEHYQATSILGRLRYIGANLLLLPGILDLPPVISAAWSLSYEFVFYLLLPLLVMLLRFNAWGRKHRVMFWASMIIGYLAFVSLHPQAMPLYRFQDGSYVRFTLFLSGMIVEEVLQTERGLRLFSNLVQVLGLGAVITSLALLMVSEFHTVHTQAHASIEHAVIRVVLVLTMYTAVCCLTLHPQGILTRWFNYAPLRWTGNISYSFYLIHGFVLNSIAVVVGHLSWARQHPFTAAPVLTVLSFGASFTAATVLFLSIERPFSLSQTKAGERKTEMKVEPRREKSSITRGGTPGPEKNLERGAD